MAVLGGVADWLKRMPKSDLEKVWEILIIKYKTDNQWAEQSGWTETGNHSGNCGGMCFLYNKPFDAKQVSPRGRLMTANCDFLFSYHECRFYIQTYDYTVYYSNL